MLHMHRIHPPMIVVGIDDPGAVASSRLQIFEYSEDTRWVGNFTDAMMLQYFSIFRKWQNIHSIVGVVFDPVHDVAFAPNLGRYVGSSMSIHSNMLAIWPY